MARPSPWNSPTTAIRVPAHLVDHLLEIAKRLDQGFVQNPSEDVYVPKTLVTVDSEQFTIGGETLSALDAEKLDRLADIAYAKIAHLRKDKQLWILGELAKHWGEPHG